MVRKALQLAPLAALGFCGCAALPPSEPAPAFVLRADWEPLRSTTYGVEKEPELARVLSPQPAVAEAEYGWSDVEGLLPPKGARVGDVWEVSIDEALPFLRQLHPSATGELHHYVVTVRLSELPPSVTQLTGAVGPVDVAALRESGVKEYTGSTRGAAMGARATLLREDGELDVLLRVHAEFELVEERVQYTPAQFEGRLVVDPRARTVRSFTLAVPDRITNVDVNVRNPGTSVVRADIGHVRRLGLWSDAPPPDVGGDLLAAGRRRLLEAFYPWYTVGWSGLAEAWENSRRSGKPIHLVVLFGALDDESC